MCYDYTECSSCRRRINCIINCYCSSDEESDFPYKCDCKDCKSFQGCRICGSDICDKCILSGVKICYECEQEHAKYFCSLCDDYIQYRCTNEVGCNCEKCIPNQKCKDCSLKICCKCQDKKLYRCKRCFIIWKKFKCSCCNINIFYGFCCSNGTLFGFEDEHNNCIECNLKICNKCFTDENKKCFECYLKSKVKNCLFCNNEIQTKCLQNEFCKCIECKPKQKCRDCSLNICYDCSEKGLKSCPDCFDNWKKNRKNKNKNKLKKEKVIKNKSPKHWLLYV